MRVELTSAVMDALCRYAAEAAPQEACGLLLGERVAAGWRVDAVLPAANVHPQPKRFFEIDPVTLIAAHRAARGGGASVIGCFHSHPSGIPEPSAADAAAAARDGSVWAIVAGGAVAFHQAIAEGFRPLAYVLSSAAGPG